MSLIALIGAYDDALRPGPDGRSWQGLALGPFLRFLLARHMNRVLSRLTRRLHANAALAGRSGHDDPAIAMLESF